MMMMMMMLEEMNILEQYLKLLMKKYLLNVNQSEMNIVDVYLLLIFELMMTAAVVVLVH
jgi:hypothetical protein